MINEADNDGNTALHYAIAYGLERSAAALVALGAQTNVKNNVGQVPVFTTALRRIGNPMPE